MKNVEKTGNYLRETVNFIIKIIVGEKCNDKFSQWKKCKRVRMFGPQILKKFKLIADRNNLKYSPIYGTLLGIYREHGFIKHDDDIDIAFDYETMSYNFLTELKGAGFEMIQFFVSDTKDCIHFAFKIHKVKFDLYSYNIEKNHVTLSAPTCEKYAIEIFEKTNRFLIERAEFDFKGYSKDNALCDSLSIFSNSKEILEIIYGPNFMTPIKDAHSGTISDNYRIVPIEESYYKFYQKKDADKLLTNEQYYNEFIKNK